MSASVSTRTKTISDSGHSESSDNPLDTDRWTNLITYRQLVISSCISILQLWWHPYLHDLKKLLPFLFLYNVFSLFFAYPLFYLELALGVVSKKGVLNCWDMAPVARGVGFTMLASSVFTILSVGAVCAWSLALLVHSFHSFLPWLHCAASALPACAARHRPLAPGSETPAQSFFFNFVLNLRREGLEGGLGKINWELSYYYIVSWILIYFISVKRIYSYSKLILFKDALTYFVLVSCAIGAFSLHGAGIMFRECDWTVLTDGTQMWCEAIEYALMQMTISQGSLVMLGTYCPKEQHKLGTTSILAFAISKITCMTCALTLGAAHGALTIDYGNYTDISSGSSSAMILWSDFAARVPGSQFWSALIFFTLFLVSLSTAALMVQTIMSTFTGQSIRKITWAFLIFICLSFCLIGILTVCTQGGLYILRFLMDGPVSKLRVPIAATITLVATYLYGQTTFCENVYFAVGEYPSVFMRVCWAFIPWILICVFIADMGTWSTEQATVGRLLVIVALMPIVLFILSYVIFKCRTRNMVQTEK